MYKNNLGAPVGGLIEMILDFNKWEIQFTRKAICELGISEKVTTAKIGESFKGKDIYVFVRLRNPRD